MKATVDFLGRGQGFNKQDILGYGHGFLIAQDVVQKLRYILYASQRHPDHASLKTVFERHYNGRYTLLGGGSIVSDQGKLKMFPLTSSLGYIPMIVSGSILATLEGKIKHLGFTDTIHLETHDDAIPQAIKTLSPDWERHILNFSPSIFPEK